MRKRIFSGLLVLAIFFSCVSMPVQAVSAISMIGTGKFTLPGSDGFGIDVYGNYSYVGARDGGLRVFDITDKTKPVDITAADDAYLGTTVIDGNSAVLVHEGYLYAGFRTDSPGGVKKGVRKYSLDNPAEPQLVFVYEANNPNAMMFHNNVLHVADRSAGVKIYAAGQTKPVKTMKETGAEQVTGLVAYESFLYVSYANAGLLVYSLPETGYPVLQARRAIEGSNVNEILVNDDAVFLFDQGLKRISIVNLNSINGELSLLDEAQVVKFSNGQDKFDARDGLLDGDYLYVTTGSQLYIFDVSNIHNIKICDSISKSALYFRKQNQYVIAGARTNGMAIFQIGSIPPGQEIIPYEVRLQQLLEENTKYTPITFGDIEGHWARGSIEKLVNLGIMNGTAPGVFTPEGSISRADFSAVLTRALNMSPVSYAGAYADVTDDHPYASVMQIVYDAGLINPAMAASGYVLPAQAVVREELADMAVRGMEYIRAQEMQAGTVFFQDDGDISPWAYPSVTKAVYAGLLSDWNTPAFYPGQPVTRAEAAAITDRLLQSLNGDALNLTEYRQAPIILRVSDSVKAGELFTVYGEGMASEEFELRLAKAEDAAYHPAPVQGAVSLVPVYADAEGHYATFESPAQMEPGAYLLWVKNQYGWSKPGYLNQARAQWIGSDVIAEGNEVYLNGRNLDGNEFGANRLTAVRLVKDGQTFAATAAEVNPFMVRFTVGSEVPQGEYRVEATNDGILWTALTSGQTLKVLEQPEDPLGLGVAWAGEFNWAGQVNVKDFGALGDGTTDDTHSIQTAIDTVKAAGGGVVHFPEGVYVIETLSLPGNMVLSGEGMTSTKLLYRPVVEGKTAAQLNAATIIQSDSSTGVHGRQGLANLTLDIDTVTGITYQPQRYLWLGGSWNPTNPGTRTANYLFLKGVQIGSPSFDWNAADPDEPLAPRIYKANMVFSANEHVLVEDSKFLGDNANLTSTYMNRYLSFRNNEVNTFYGNIYVHGLYTVYDHNTITRAPWTVGKDASVSRQGIYTRSDTYVAHNTITNTGTYLGDGEVVAAESYNAGTSMYGNVLAAGSASLKVAPKTNAAGFPLTGGAFPNPWNMAQKGYGDWNVMIVDGKGMGQSRTIVAADKESRFLQVDRPWTVVPDSTSLFTVYLPMDNMTFYQNEVVNGSWGFLHYGPSNDTVISGNTGNGMQGIDLSIILKETYAADSTEGIDCRVWFNYFNRSEDNQFDGPAWKSAIGGIQVNVKYESGELHGKHAYGIEIRDNAIMGDGRNGAQIVAHLDSLNAQGAKSTGYGSVNGIVIRHANSKKKPEINGTQAVIIQGNQLSNLDRGITLGGHDYRKEADPGYLQNLAQAGSSGVVIEGNSFTDVVQPYVRYGDENTVMLGDE
ncbi:MAG: Fibronectin type domain protein [Paenibacillaceae bacterium]|jgi:hypothetical protein|nr:Fibronectin type domain protein [Paenibacillaceae bacterium]